MAQRLAGAGANTIAPSSTRSSSKALQRSAWLQRERYAASLVACRTMEEARFRVPRVNDFWALPQDDCHHGMLVIAQHR